VSSWKYFLILLNAVKMMFQSDEDNTLSRITSGPVFSFNLACLVIIRGHSSKTWFLKNPLLANRNRSCKLRFLYVLILGNILASCGVRDTAFRVTFDGIYH